MLSILIAIYRANPFRPHCGEGRHSALCEFTGMRSRCTAKNN